MNRNPSKQLKLSNKQRIQDIFIATAKNKTLLMLIVGAILISVGYSQFSSTLPQLINLKIENAVQIFSYCIVANSITVLIFQYPLTAMIEKTSLYRSITIGISIFAVGLLLFNFFTSVWMFIVSMVVFSVGEIFTFPLMTASIEKIAPAAICSALVVIARVVSDCGTLPIPCQSSQQPYSHRPSRG